MLVVHYNVSLDEFRLEINIATSRCDDNAFIQLKSKCTTLQTCYSSNDEYEASK